MRKSLLITGGVQRAPREMSRAFCTTEYVAFYSFFLFVVVSSLDHDVFSTLCLRISNMSNEQVDPKFMRNQRYAKHGSEKALREARAAAQSA